MGYTKLKKSKKKNVGSYAKVTPYKPSTSTAKQRKKAIDNNNAGISKPFIEAPGLKSDPGLED